MARVFVSTHLHPYTGGRSEVEADGSTLAEIADDLERRYPGIRFRVIDEQDRIREHIHFFVGEEMARSLDEPVKPDDQVSIIGALSGG